ncbi:MAG TPA: GNAT family N-acetyltransferase [Ktedonobacteraceae bacterium]|jgi:GNAT superfamily N-acetyltransferase|nr:GNAT family N-acetyltransferase [Ktedonobacteraceae bacterium]
MTILFTDRALLRLHVEAVWGVRLPPIEEHATDVTLLPESQRPSWQLCAAVLSSGSVSIWRPEVAVTQREAQRARANAALALPPAATTEPDISREVALHRAAPAKLDTATARTIARPITAQDQPLVEAFESGSTPYYFHPDRGPLIGVVSAGHLLSLAHSSRRTSEACELGIDTLPEARRKGYALAATVLWAEAVAQEGPVPIYSAAIENEASLKLAAAAGYRPFARIALVETTQSIMSSFAAAQDLP